MRGGA
ncbi:hypothetical protein LINPERPRIM_LOCUS3349 [Linum perenne]|jgi:rRNA 2'-O-methyltransferase fibrillarin